VLCKHEVVGSIPTGSTTLRLTATRGAAMLRVALAQHTQEPKGDAWCPAKPLGVDGLPLRRRLTDTQFRPRNIALRSIVFDMASRVI
jgi:hypothetical protein